MRRSQCHRRDDLRILCHRVRWIRCSRDRRLGVSVATAASLAAVVALTFAIVQPHGAATDMFGKPRLMIACLILLGAANALGAVATSFEMLFASRVLVGIAAGGTFPSHSDDRRSCRPRSSGRAEPGAGGRDDRKSAGCFGSRRDRRFSRLARCAYVLGAIMVVASVAVMIGFRRGGVASPQRGVSFASLKEGYRTILHNPNARVCFTAVFIEGLCVFGLFPFVAAFLFELGETRASIPGVVIAAFAVGGLFYSMSVSRLLPRFGVNRLMIGGAAVVALQFVIIALGPRWEIQAISFLIMGWGFYSLHGSLQVFSTDLAPEARASAMSLHAFCFFMGQAVGPIIYGFSLGHAGKQATLILSATAILVLGIVAARLLNQEKPAEMSDI